jgi:hypothetical protein
MKWKILILSLVSLLMFQGLYAQKKIKTKKIILSGFIKDSNNEPIKDAIIKVHNSERSDRTNSKGFYRIKIKPETEKILIITPKYGYKEILLDNELSLDVIFPAVVSAEQKEISHEEMVDLGYMKRKMSENSYNIVTIDGRKLNPNKYNSVLQMIKAESPGGYKISNQALFIIDGSSAQGGISVLNSISPTQVKSINVLTGAAKAAYGSRGFYGVVIIETKSATNAHDL